MTSTSLLFIVAYTSHPIHFNLNVADDVLPQKNLIIILLLFNIEKISLKI